MVERPRRALQQALAKDQSSQKGLEGEAHLHQQQVNPTQRCNNPGRTSGSATSCYTIPSCNISGLPFLFAGVDEEFGQKPHKSAAASTGQTAKQPQGPITGHTVGAAAGQPHASSAAAPVGLQGRQHSAAPPVLATAGANANPQLAGSSSGKKGKKRARVIEETQTEYVVIPPKAKKRGSDLLTDRQQEVMQRQRQGDALCQTPCVLVPHVPMVNINGFSIA